MKNSIRIQLYLLGGILSFALIVAFGYSLYALYQLQSSASKYLSENTSLSLTIGRINGYDRQQEAILARVLDLAENAKDQAKFADRIDFEHDTFAYFSNQLNQEYNYLITMASEELGKSNPSKVHVSYSVLLEAAQQTRSSYQIYTKLMDDVFELLKSGDYATAKNIFEDVEKADERLHRLVGKLETTRRAILDSTRNEALGVESFTWVLCALTLGTLLVLLLSIHFISRNFMGPLTEAIKRAQYIAKGGRQLAGTGNPPLEFGMLFNAINDVLAGINKTEDEHIENMKQLQKTNEELKVFASAMAHDLKNPLNVIMGYTELLQSKNHVGTEEHRWLLYTKNAVEEMLELIEGLLNYSHLGLRAPIEKALIDLNEVVEDVLFSLQPIIQSNKAKINISNMPMLEVNRLFIRQAFQNLITNAMKFRSTEDPVITISATELDSEWQIAVNDNGVGIDMNEQEKIFEIFTRGMSNRKTNGSGVGLATVKKIVEKHNGRIWVKSKPGRGSTFYITLPKLDSAKKGASPTLESSQSASF